MPGSMREPADVPGRGAPRGTADDVPSDVVELRLRVTRQMAAGLEAGVPCREVRIERTGDDRVALVLSAGNREQWLMHVLASAERAPWN